MRAEIYVNHDLLCSIYPFLINNTYNKKILAYNLSVTN